MSSALVTITDYINDARVLLQDQIAPYRYDDPSMLTAMNVTLLEGRRIRPDLFIFARHETGGAGVQSFSANAGQKVFIEEQFRLAFLYGMCAQALIRDQEDIQDARVAMFNGTFNTILLGVKPTVAAAPGPS